MINNLTAPLHETPLTFWENFAAADATKRKKHEIRLARAASKGYFRGTLLPCLMWVACGIVAIIACCYGDSSTEKPDSETTSAYNEATEAYYNGELDAANKILQPILAKNPKVPNLSMLMAKVQFARKDRTAALHWLNIVRDTSLCSPEIDHYIRDLSSTDSGSGTSLPGQLPTEPKR